MTPRARVRCNALQPDVIGRQDDASREIAVRDDDLQFRRTVRPLFSAEIQRSVAECGLHPAHARHERAHLVGIEGGHKILEPQRAIEAQVLFDAGNSERQGKQGE